MAAATNNDPWLLFMVQENSGASRTPRTLTSSPFNPFALSYAIFRTVLRPRSQYTDFIISMFSNLDSEVVETVPLYDYASADVSSFIILTSYCCLIP
jgi:hypothetical protein